MKRILGFTVAIGFLYRLLFLGKRQLWTDELLQALVVRASSAAGMLRQLKDGMVFPAPLDYFIQKGCVLVLGESTWTLRLHAVIFGTLSIWMVYRIALYLFDRRVALYSSVLFAFFPLQYHYSQEGRPHALFVFLTLVAYDLLFRRLRAPNGGDRWMGWISLCLTLVLLLYSSFLGLVVMASQFLALAASAGLKLGAAGGVSDDGAPGVATDLARARWSHLVCYSLAGLVAVSLFFPWIQYAWSRPLMPGASEIANPKLALRIIKELGDNSYPVAGLTLLGVITGIRALWRHRRTHSLMWLILWSSISLPAVLVLLHWAGYFFAIHNILHATPPLILLAGYGLSHVGERLTILDRIPYQLSAPAAAYAGLMVIASIWIAQNHWGRELVDWRGTAASLAEEVQPGDALAAPKIYPLLEYYAPQLGSYRTGDLDPGLGSLAGERTKRRIVICYDGMRPDPCEGFRSQAVEDPGWDRRRVAAFTIFRRENKR